MARRPEHIGVEIVTMDAGQRMRFRGVALAGAWTLGAASLVVALIMAVTLMHLRRVDPLHTPELAGLRTAYVANQGDEALKEKIRVLDLMARRAFFTSRQQLKGGAWALAAMASGALLLLLLAEQCQERQPDVRRLPGEGAGWSRWQSTRRGLWVAGAVLTAAALALRIGLAPPADTPAGGASSIKADKDVVKETPPPSSYWAGFRGPDGNGVAAVTSAPVKWDGVKGVGVRWKTAIPLPGFGSPVVWQKRVFVTGGTAQRRAILGLDAETGSLLWTTDTSAIPGAPAVIPATSDDTGLAASTPATDGERVYALFATGELLAVDMAGRMVWGSTLGTPENHYGHSSSLLVSEGLLYVQMDDAARPRLMAFDAATGRLRWERKRQAISWASPVMARSGERRILVLCDSAGVEAYGAEDGETLWRVDCLGGEVAPSAAVSDGTLVVAGDNAKACGLKFGVDLPALLWEWSDGLPDTASPLAFRDRVLMATSQGTLVMLDIHTGKRVWQHEMPKVCYASPVLAAGRIYLVDLDGVTRVLEAGDAYRELAVCPLGEMVGATPAFVEGRIFLRGLKHLVCVGE